MLAQPDAEAADILAACVRVRDLVNTPTEDMGPDQLEQVCCELAERFGARIDVISGDSRAQETRRGDSRRRGRGRSW